MLEPQSRAALTEQLRPPSGFELSHAVGTTFTLDLATALSIPLAFASHHVTAEDDNLGVLGAVRRASHRIDIFAQAGELSMGIRSDLVAFLEPMVHPVLPRRGLFHPKVWFLEYRAGDRLAYRFLCSSRNLTADRSWDVVVRLDGQPAAAGDESHATAINRPLFGLLTRMPELCVQPMGAVRRQRLDAFADRWRTVDWVLPDDTRNLTFHVFGTRETAPPDLHGKRALIISPFLSDDGLANLRSQIRTDTHLISRAVSLDRLAAASLNAKLKTYILDDAATSTDDDDDTDVAHVPPTERLAGLHAKAIIVDRADGSHVLLGSANATAAAWRDNVEVMVELTGALGKFGVQATLDALGELKDPYPTEGGQEARADEEAERRLEALVRRVAGTRVTARVSRAAEPYDLSVWADLDDEELAAAGTSFRWSLLTRPDLGAGILPRDESDAVVLHDLPLTDITPFLVLTVRDAAGNEGRTILLARLLDDIDTRRDAVIARQLTDSASFVRLLTLLLELAGVGMPELPAMGASGFFGMGTGDDSAGAGLFEALIRAVGANHHGLSDARRIIDFVRAHGDSDELLPLDFEELWSSVWQAHLEMAGEPS